MNHDLRQSAWRLYRKYNMVFGALLLILGIAAIFGATYVFPNSQASTITLGIGTSFIASVIFATLTRYFIEKEFEDLLRETIDKALTESADKILHRVDFKIDHLRQFMPIEPFVSRDQASDVVERKAHSL